MNNLTINIGLTVGTTEPKNQLSLTKERLLDYFIFFNSDCRVDTGQWTNQEGETITERVFIAQLEAGNVSRKVVKHLIEQLCITLSQDAIAYIHKEQGELVYNPFFEGEKQAFDFNYFKEF